MDASFFWGRLAAGDDSGWDEALERCIRQESSAGRDELDILGAR